MRVYSAMRAQVLAASFAATPVAAFLGFDFFKHPEPATTWLAKETGILVDDGQGVSPRPTAAPYRPQNGGIELLKRFSGYTMGTDTCGFVASEWSDAFTCVRVGATCTNDGTFIGCCTNSGTDCFSTVKTACLDYTAYLSSACDSRTGLNTLCCSSSDAQFCHSYTFSTTATPGKTLTLIDCDTTKGAGLLLDYPPTITRSGYVSTSSRTTTSSKSTSTSSTTKSTSSSSSTTTSDSTTTTPTQPPTTTPVAGGGGNSTPVGPIVGGVVGGIGAIGLIVLALLFFYRRGKGKNDTDVPPTAQDPAPHQPPMVHSSPSSPGNVSNAAYNPHYSYQQPYPPQGGQGLAYAVPNASHHNSMYGSPPLEQQGWYGEPGKNASPVGSGGYVVPPQQPQQPQQPQYQYPQELPHELPHQNAPYMQSHSPPH